MCPVWIEELSLSCYLRNLTFFSVLHTSPPPSLQHAAFCSVAPLRSFEIPSIWYRVNGILWRIYIYKLVSPLLTMLLCQQHGPFPSCTLLTDRSGGRYRWAKFARNLQPHLLCNFSGDHTQKNSSYHVQSQLVMHLEATVLLWTPYRFEQCFVHVRNHSTPLANWSSNIWTMAAWLISYIKIQLLVI